MIKLNFNKVLNKQLELKINLHIPMGECIAIYGKSGAGKSSILRLISGLDSITSGIIQAGNTLFEKKENLKTNLLQSLFFRKTHHFYLPPQKRNIGFIFQNHALLPNLSVKENILFGLKDKNKDSIKKLNNLADLLNISPLLNKNIFKLSGGESQRVSIARALISEPKILLLDEPLNALDTELKLSLLKQLKIIFDTFKISTFLVSHDIDEVLTLSKYIIHLDNGSVKSFTKSMDFKQSSQIYGNIISLNSKLAKVRVKSIHIFARFEDMNLKVGDRVVLIEDNGSYFAYSIFK